MTKVIDTTPGRMKLAALLPRNPNVGYRLLEKNLTKKEIGNLIDVVYRHCGQKATVIFADQMMGLGFREAAKAGISFGKDDIVIPAKKVELVAETRTQVEEYEQQYADGLITRREVQQGGRRLGQGHGPGRRRHDGRDRATARADRRAKTPTSFNSVYMMANSGARGSPRRRCAAGRHARPDGQAVRRDHRDADHLELQGRADRPASTSTPPTAPARVWPTPR